MSVLFTTVIVGAIAILLFSVFAKKAAQPAFGPGEFRMSSDKNTLEIIPRGRPKVLFAYNPEDGKL